MLRTIQGAIAVSGVLVAAATVVAAMDGKLANLLIGAAMVASNGVVLYFVLDRMMERRLGDAYDEGRGALVRSMLRDLVAVKNEAKN